MSEKNQGAERFLAMLISQEHKFIFIHVYKNAGTSITHAMMPYVANRLQRGLCAVFFGRGQHKINKVFGMFNRALDPQPYDMHIKSTELVEKMGMETFKSFFSFAIVRNPWDWQVSLYKYMSGTPAHFQHQLANSFDDFDQYIKWRCAEEVRFQKDFVYSADGELLVDFIGRYESLDEDFQSICSNIGIDATLPTLNVSNTIPYQQYYSKETRELVQRTFEADIQLFEYAFE